MKIHRQDEETVALEELDQFCLDLLRKIPPSADPSGSAAAEERLFPAPTRGAEPEADEDWKEYVEPDLRRLFQDAIEIVEADLEKLASDGTNRGSVLHLPVENLEAWIHALNQARLALSARHGFKEGDLERELSMEGGTRSMALFQIHFYGLLQEFFLRQLDEP